MVTVNGDLFLETLGFLLAQKFYINCPKKSTRMAKAFLATMKVDGNDIVFTLPYYAYYVINGSAPHEIKPVEAQSLKFSDKKGDNIFAKKVMHPGNPPNFFIQDTLHREFEEVFKQALKISI